MNMLEVSRPKRIIMRAFGLILGILCGFVLFEGGARMFYKAPWHERLIAEQSKSLRRPYEMNRFGFRDVDYPVTKPARTYRILVLGDSFTFGGGVPDREDIFPEIIEKRLNALDFGKKIERVEVLNTGIPGSVTEDWLAVAKHIWHYFEPDAVLIVYFLRDGISTASIPGFFDKIRAGITTANRESFLYRNLYTARVLKNRLDKRRISEHYTRQFVLSYLGDQQQTARWKRSQSTLLSIRDYARQRSADVGFVIFPILVQLDKDYPFLGICEHIEAFTRHHAMPTHNLLSAFLKFRGPELWVSPYNQHPNEKAHLIAAESLVPFVADMVRGQEADPTFR